MTDIDERNPKKQTEGGQSRRLELKKTVETGQVRQSFAHGRSKMVTVEVRKKRTFTPDARSRAGEAVRLDRDGPSFSGTNRNEIARSRDGGTVGLTNSEKAARVRALQDAIRAEEERQNQPPPEEPAVAEAVTETPAPDAPADAAEAVGGEAPAEVAEPAAAAATDAQPQPDEPVATEAAEAPADLSAGAPKAEALQAEEPAAAAPAPGPAEAAKPGEAAPAKPGEGTSTKPAEADANRAKPKRPPAARVEPRKVDAGRRDDAAGRRGGKINITDVLDDAAGERMRSLASVRRAREKERLKQLSQRMENQKVVRDVVIPESLTVQELANRMAERSTDVIKALMRMGVMATINHSLDADTAELLAVEFGHNVRRVTAADVELGLKGDEDIADEMVRRPPVVTVMGHVDHGKTSLLDALRKTDVAVHEAGGITQHIGAYQVTMASGERITFIDTPGHEAFTQMRARGAKATDIVVLVVAADDGVMPQTVEAINHAKAAGVPIIVAVNKIDRADADPQRVRTELLQYSIQVEEMGGETLSVDVSAKVGTNLDKLTEAILLQSELLDLKANPSRPAEGLIIESKVERGRGTVATVLVQRGTLRVGDIFVAGSEWGRVRGMTDALGGQVTEAGPSTPIEVLGLNGTPAAGDDVVVVANEGRAREVTEFRQRRTRDARVSVGRGTFEQLFHRIQQGERRELPVVIKADVHGSAEAIVGALEKLGGDLINVVVLHSGVGGINETDVGLARASDALIIGFNVRANPQARELARRDGVDIRYYSIIYELADDVKSMLSGMLTPILRENILGYADIREVFNISKVGKVAGCRVTEGIVKRGGKVRLLRDNVVIHEGELSQLKHFKEDVREVREGFECGIALANYHDIQVGDRIECFEMEEVARQL
ncbi:MAG: translation initiation factor IF-2 [Rhodospirillales bacterium]|nr:translation initiation factor IF-2 [Rhodospirillales bacterium]